MKTKLFLIVTALAISSLVIAGGGTKAPVSNNGTELDDPPHIMFPFLPCPPIFNEGYW